MNPLFSTVIAESGFGAAPLLGVICVISVLTITGIYLCLTGLKVLEDSRYSAYLGHPKPESTLRWLLRKLKIIQ